MWYLLGKWIIKKNKLPKKIMWLISLNYSCLFIEVYSKTYAILALYLRKRLKKNAILFNFKKNCYSLKWTFDQVLKFITTKLYLLNWDWSCIPVAWLWPRQHIWCFPFSFVKHQQGMRWWQLETICLTCHVHFLLNNVSFCFSIRSTIPLY